MTPGELRGVVSRVLNIPSTRVERIQTGIRQAGMITKAGRGRSAAQMTFRDAAILLVGSVVSLGLADLIEALRKIDQAPYRGVTLYDYTPPGAKADPWLQSDFSNERGKVQEHIALSPNCFDVLARILFLLSEDNLFIKTHETNASFTDFSRDCTFLVLGGPDLAEPTVMIDYQIGPLSYVLTRYLVSFGPWRDHRNWFGRRVSREGRYLKNHRVFAMWGIGLDTLRALAEEMRGSPVGFEDGSFMERELVNQS